MNDAEEMQQIKASQMACAKASIRAMAKCVEDEGLGEKV